MSRASDTLFRLRNYLLRMSNVVLTLPVKEVNCKLLESVLQRMMSITMTDKNQLAVFIRMETELMSMRPLVRWMHYHTEPTPGCDCLSIFRRRVFERHLKNVRAVVAELRTPAPIGWMRRVQRGVVVFILGLLCSGMMWGSDCPKCPACPACPNLVLDHR
jgi:hypothetical protein